MHHTVRNGDPESGLTNADQVSMFWTIRGSALIEIGHLIKRQGARKGVAGRSEKLLGFV